MASGFARFRTWNNNYDTSSIKITYTELRGPLWGGGGGSTFTSLRLSQNLYVFMIVQKGSRILSEPPRGVAWLALTGGVLPCWAQRSGFGNSNLSKWTRNLELLNHQEILFSFQVPLKSPTTDLGSLIAHNDYKDTLILSSLGTSPSSAVTTFQVFSVETANAQGQAHARHRLVIRQS